MTLTKADLQQALKQQEKTIIGQISEFLEKHVIEPIFTLKNDVSGLKKDVSGLKGDVSGLKKDVSGLKSDVSGLKADVTGLKHDVSGLKEDVASLNQQTQSMDAELETIGKTLEGKADSVLVTKVEESILKRFDRFEENLGDKLENHEKRITRLEQQPPVFPQA
ncbi:hypothetical protein COT65_00710 [Candidatus Shapirobacteria bacterium CG09_land_8_20_14_0_10_47_13]|uniref:Uncharacterized protein n=1 Tax=Candidatus Shapirobacteria bacterium CG09_land_8_20_14_0_10_47_13 TaxID=1974481 RepID=A0A2H0WN59_9BACT|nr:MAG: hypothetical protein COT65_00710 [Candidatus Shapirobacteria bacterium CG09_land_8_20_14_0_10_47_13]